MAVVLVFVLSGCFGAVLGVTLSPCGSDNTAEVIQGSNTTFTCSGLDSSKQVQWTLSYNNDNGGGSCVPGQKCETGSLGSVSTPSRVSGTEVRTVINPTKLSSKDLVKLGTLKCGQENDAATCQMDYIVPVRGTCSVQAGRKSSRFQLDGGCTLQSGAESSRNRYSCKWRSHEGTPWEHDIKLRKDNYQTACTVSGQPLPSTTGQYTYNVTLLPGRNTVKAAGTVSITRPDAPSVPGCGGDDYIPENTAVTCTCSTTTIGQPQGRLLWVKDGDSSATQTGAYGASSLTVSQTLHRDDHQRSQFGCAVQWTANISGPTVTFKVGYPPTQVSLQLNKGDVNITVTEHQTVDFSCQNSNGRPDPTLKLLNKDNSSVLASELSALSHEVVGRCEDSGQYVCTADNGIGSKFTGKFLALFVTCAPRGIYDVGEVNFISQPVSVTFDITAYPVPYEVTFRYLGPNDTSAGSPDDDDIAHIQINGTCHAKPGVVYQSTCTVTVTNVTEDTAAGFYRVTIRNTQGHGEFRLHVLYRAPATPAPNTGGGNKGPSIGAIIGGVIAAIVVLALVAVVFIFIRRRRGDLSEAKLQSAGGGSSLAANEQLEAGYHGRDNPAYQSDPEQPQSPERATPPPPGEGPSRDGEGKVSVEVDESDQPASAAGLTPEGASAPAPVYAVVDKTRKKKKKAAAAPHPKSAAKKAKKAAAQLQAKAGQDKQRDREDEGHIYGNVQTKQHTGNGDKGAAALEMENRAEVTGAEGTGEKVARIEVNAGRQVNTEGLIYTSVDFKSDSAADYPRPDLTDDGVLYSKVDFIQTSEQQQ